MAEESKQTIQIWKDMLKLPQYLIKFEKISGFTDIQEIEQDIKNKKTGTEEKATLYAFGIYFDGSKIDLYFNIREVAIGIRQKVLSCYSEWYESKLI